MARPRAPQTAYGNWRRGTGILNNELYVGKLVWNRLRQGPGDRQAASSPQSAERLDHPGGA